MNEARLALSRVQMRESFVMQETADIFVANLTRFAQTETAEGPALEEALAASVEQAYGFGSQSSGSDRKPFIYNDGMAIIPIHGALINRFGGSWGFVTGYNYIRRMMNAALEDDDVKLIVFDVDSPGGEAAGCFELAAEIRASRDVKPSIAVVDSLAASAGYALASAASRMVATPSSKIGSIGVVAMHIDFSGALDQAGIKVTYIEAPEDGLKTAGSPFKPLGDEAKKEFQNSVNRSYDDFVALVGANRGLGDDEVRATKAKVYRADEALAIRLIDEVKTPSEAVSAFVAELADEEPIESEDEDMSTQTKPGSEATSAAPAATLTQADIDAAVNADRERMSAIKALPEAASRPKLAETLALGGYTVDQAKALLGAAAEEAAAPAAPAAGTEATSTTTTTTAAPAVDTTNHLEAAMDKTQQPNVGAGGEGAPAAGGEKSPEELAASILADQGSVVGTNYGEAAKA